MGFEDAIIFGLLNRQPRTVAHLLNSWIGLTDALVLSTADTTEKQLMELFLRTEGLAQRLRINAAMGVAMKRQADVVVVHLDTHDCTAETVMPMLKHAFELVKPGGLLVGDAYTLLIDDEELDVDVLLEKYGLQTTTTEATSAPLTACENVTEHIAGFAADRKAPLSVTMLGERNLTFDRRIIDSLRCWIIQKPSQSSN